MFTFNNFTFFPKANMVAVERDGKAFCTLLQTTVDWANITVEDPNNTGVVLRFLCDSVDERNEEVVSALDLLTLTDGMAKNIWAYVKYGQVTASENEGTSYIVEKQDNGYKVIASDGRFVVLDTKTPLGSGDLKDWAIAIMTCLTCNTGKKFMITAGIPEHNLTTTGEAFNLEIKDFWNALTSEMDGQFKNHGHHQHVMVSAIAGELSSMVDKCEDSDGPIAAVMKIYFNDQLGVSLEKGRIDVLGFFCYFTEDDENDTVVITEDDIRELGRYLQYTSSFPLNQIVPERFSFEVLHQTVNAAGWLNATEPMFGFTKLQWELLTRSVKSISLPVGDDAWIRVLVNAFYQHAYLAKPAVISLALEQLKNLKEDERISNKIYEVAKTVIPPTVHSW